ncbi:helix-turn-helix transcriptional regulator [Sphingomonas sp. CL5.1]|uniref:helix-turn-helix domain-containing protein n=1 Tax=Sphingomonas sp. CL5.1 TaxID=2653203 RepID=UPI0015841CBE|nr:AraC family transcriptional regulator [Sphingomonas sp. CL5.1]QKR99780.1 helix-turn-helix transcriptional regulator [Sphingomonas sp. CL5.1]
MAVEQHVDNRVGSVAVAEAGALAVIRGVHDYAEHTLRASSEGLGWQHLFMLDFHEPPFSAAFPGAKDHLLLFLRRGSVRVTTTVAGARRETTFYAGQLNLVPARAEVAVTTGDEVDCLHLYVSAGIVAEVAGELRGTADVELVPRLGLQDQLLGGLVQACATEMHVPTKRSSAYVEHLSWALAAQLVQTCSDRVPAPHAAFDGHIPLNKLRAVEEFVLTHLENDIGVADMARVAGYGPVRFGRLFRKAVGVPPYRYIQERRVEAVRNALYSPARLADIATATGFCNQEHMTRVFREFHGITPGRYRRINTGRDID